MIHVAKQIIPKEVVYCQMVIPLRHLKDSEPRSQQLRGLAKSTSYRFFASTLVESPLIGLTRLSNSSSRGQVHVLVKADEIYCRNRLNVQNKKSAMERVIYMITSRGLSTRGS
jgi:hypothetical protein